MGERYRDIIGEAAVAGSPADSNDAARAMTDGARKAVDALQSLADAMEKFKDFGAELDDFAASVSRALRRSGADFISCDFRRIGERIFGSVAGSVAASASDAIAESVGGGLLGGVLGGLGGGIAGALVGSLARLFKRRKSDTRELPPAVEPDLFEPARFVDEPFSMLPSSFMLRSAPVVNITVNGAIGAPRAIGDEIVKHVARALKTMSGVGG